MMDQEQRRVAEAKVKIARDAAQKRRAPDHSLGAQVRDPKDCLSVFDVMRRRFGPPRHSPQDKEDCLTESRERFREIIDRIIRDAAKELRSNKFLK